MISGIIGLHSEPLTLSTLHPFSLWHFSICRPQSTVHILSSLKVSHVQYFALQIKGRCWIWIKARSCISPPMYYKHVIHRPNKHSLMTEFGRRAGTQILWDASIPIQISHLTSWDSERSSTSDCFRIFDSSSDTFS